MQWLREADDRPITQITPPNEVLEFIESKIGLADMCMQHANYLAAYAPQLTIPGFGGPFEPFIEELFQGAVAWYQQRMSEGSSFGTATTRDGRVPRCPDAFALRDPDFGGIKAAFVACAFVQGEGVANGPPVKYYSTIDYLAWLLSAKSEWLGSAIREFLTEGMAAWGVWIGDGYDRRAEDFGYEIDRDTAGEFADAVKSAQSVDALRITDKARRDLLHRLEFSAKLLDLPERADELISRVTAPDFLRHYYEDRD